jgi:hypothetical protein
MTKLNGEQLASSQSLISLQTLQLVIFNLKFVFQLRALVVCCKWYQGMQLFILFFIFSFFA